MCLRVDPVAARVEATLRCRLKREFPEGGLLLTQPESTQEVSCIESVPGWSTPLTDDQTRDAVDAAGFDWSEGVTLEDRTVGWRFGLRPRAVRIFVDGSGDGLPGLIEVHELQRSQPFHLLFASEAWEGLEAWVRTECRGYQEYAIRGGLPSGWRLASIEAAEKDSSVRNAFPILAFSERARLTFRGGIRSSDGNTFFAFAPPELSLDGGDHDDQLWCNDQLLQPTPVGLYELPNDLPRGSPINIEVRRGGRTHRRRSLFLSSDSAWVIQERLIAAADGIALRRIRPMGRASGQWCRRRDARGWRARAQRSARFVEIRSITTLCAKARGRPQIDSLLGSGRPARLSNGLLNRCRPRARMMREP